MRARHPKTTSHFVAALALPLLLAACGGGDTAAGDAVGTGLGPALAIDENNYVQVGTRAAKGSLDAAGLVQGLDAAGSVGTSKPREVHASIHAPTITGSLKHLAWAREALALSESTTALKGGDVRLAAGGTRSIACTGGGSVTITNSVVSIDRDSVGDRLALTYNRCVDLISGVYTDGGVGFEFTRVGAGRLWQGAPMTCRCA